MSDPRPAFRSHMATPYVDGARAGRDFPKQDRLLRRFEFTATQRNGRRVQTPHFTLALRSRDDSAGPRLGVTASRKVGNSVARNRVRRLVREVFRLRRESFPPGHDCVVIVRENVPLLQLREVEDELLRGLERHGQPPKSGPSSPSRRRGPERP